MKTGINFERCNVSSAELHNRRNKAYMDAVNASPNKKYSIFEDESKNNVYWTNPEYSGKSLPGLLDELRAIYKDKVGQAPQEEDRVREITDKKTGMKRTVTTAGWSPIREGVCPIKEDTTKKDFEPFIKWLESKGLHCIYIDIHHDEGYTDPVTDERRYNHHAHIGVDWINHDTGKTRKLSKEDTREMQTQLAASLQMERGVSKEITGADHLTPDEQRAKAAALELKKLTGEKTEIKAKIDALKKKLDILLGTTDKLADAVEKAQKATKTKANLELWAKSNSYNSFDGPFCGLFRTKSKDGWNYIDLDGKRVNDKPFDEASLFIDGKAMVRRNGLIAEIDTQCNVTRIIQNGIGLKH